MSDNQAVTDQKVVTFTYTILDTEGNVLEQSDMPASYIHGIDGKMYEKAEQAMTGARVGDEVEVSLNPDEGFGYPDPALIYTEKIENVPPEYRRIGAEVEFTNEAGDSMTMTVSKIENGELIVDGNHPFAGKTVVFRMTVMGVRDATMQEVGTGEVMDTNVPMSLQ
ncbi:MAG: FKBP-type peptidyl-prolyl cis-trans isomerase [Acidiferrobacteraceae bacterium]